MKSMRELMELAGNPFGGDDDGSDPINRYYERCSDFFGMFEQSDFDREEGEDNYGVPGKEIRGFQLDDNGTEHLVMRFLFDGKQSNRNGDPSGWGWYDDSPITGYDNNLQSVNESKNMREMISLMEGIMVVPGLNKARFENVSCSQCGESFGPGDSGYSHCSDHEGKTPVNEKSSSEKQARFMAACAHGADYDSCPPDKVSKEFNQADKGTKQLSNAMKEGVPAVDYCKQTNPATADVACAMEEGAMPELDDAIEQTISDAHALSDAFVEEYEAREILMSRLDQQGYSPEEITFIMNAVENHFAGDDADSEFGSDGPDDFSDDAEALASAGHGSDEDYGYADEVMEAYDLNNGYRDVHTADKDDYFPDGADSPVVDNVGPSGARQGDNPEQKKMQIAETHKELVYAYRDYLKESDQKKK